MKIFIVLIFIVLDFLTGALLALKENQFNSKRMREGLYNKASELILVSVSFLIAVAMQYYDLPYPNAINISVCTYIVIMEIGSIVENVGKINPRLIPDVIQKVFKDLGKEDKHD